MITDTAILRNIERQPKQSAGLKQLIRELGAHGHERRELAARLHELVRRGELVEVTRDRYSLPRGASGKNVILGRLHMHRDGYGFVTPESGPARHRVSGDVFINPQAIGNAMHGDRVMVELTAVRPDGRGEGRILSVAGRAHPTVVGTFHYGPRHNYVVPIDEKVKQDIIIPRGMEIPKEFGVETEAAQGRSRHRVLGEEATRRQPVEWDDLEGVVVDVEITEWPTPTQNPRGRVVEVLGREDDFGVDVEIIIRKYHLSHRFPLEVLEEAQSVSGSIAAREVGRRRDFRQLRIVTIDGESARDFDDAVYVQRLENGNFQLQVHIADVAHYVTDSSALDEEARLRGTSVYFPDRAVPMLPVELSTDICSLRPQCDRLVLSCLIEIDHQGEVVGYEICEGIIRSAERMTYTGVNAILEGDESLLRRYAPLVENFLLMRELAVLLNRKRERRGAIDFDLPEAEIEFDEFGLMKAITRSERNFAHRLIEEFMLTANESVAGYLEAKGVAALYRIHDKPEPRRVMEFEEVAAAFGYSLGVGPIPVKKFSYTDDRRPRRRDGRGDRGGQRRREVEIPEEVHITPRMYQKLTKKIAGTAEERILSYLMLRSLKQARYSEENVGHFALAAPVYTHFTSPIRRYPDLIVHRILKQVLRESAEDAEYTGDGEVPIGRGAPAGSEMPSPWSKRAGAAENSSNARRGSKKTDKRAQLSRGSAAARLTHPQPAGNGGRGTGNAGMEVIPLPELHDIAVESSDAERRAADAERELLEWKKAKFMADHVGEDFDGLIVSVTKFGFFVELTDMFIEGLVPLDSLTDDHYVYHDSTRQIIGHRNRKTYSLGDRVRVLVDRIDPVQRKIQFAIFQEEPPRREKQKGSRRVSAVGRRPKTNAEDPRQAGAGAKDAEEI
jgi:ribonuclease R